MNTGIDDAANLGWKLAAVLAGWGGDAAARLLHRRAAADRARQLAGRLGQRRAHSSARSARVIGAGVPDGEAPAGRRAPAPGPARSTTATYPEWNTARDRPRPALHRLAGDRRRRQRRPALGPHALRAARQARPPRARTPGSPRASRCTTASAPGLTLLDCGAPAAERATRCAALRRPPRRAARSCSRAHDAASPSATRPPLVLVRPDQHVAWRGAARARRRRSRADRHASAGGRERGPLRSIANARVSGRAAGPRRREAVALRDGRIAAVGALDGRPRRGGRRRARARRRRRGASSRA